MKHESAWQRIFELSKVYGTDNRQDLLPSNTVVFPESTWFQDRLNKVRAETKSELYDHSE